MKRIPIDHADAFGRLQGVLEAGGVAVVPTDTLYGLSGAISSHGAVERIAAIKRSGDDRRFLYLASSIDMVAEYVADWGCTSRRMLEAIWPAALTGIFPAGGRSPGWVGKTAAFRVPDFSRLQAAIDALGEPIISTSVNESGEPPMSDLDAIEERFGRAVDLILDAGVLPVALPSTLVDFTGPEAAVLRAGAYGWVGAAKPSK